MGKVAVICLLLALLGGCAGNRAAVYMNDPAHRANLVLSSNADETWLAELHADRRVWPAITRGYVFEDVSSYSVIIYDDQSFYMPGRYGGGYVHESVSVRSGLMVR